ncbi:MAG TPA: ABC transporter transmembrane domain-containing protein [Candidatus Latescibacteria bacterium]|nr:ABC transporter transmembrane domain-containing protein [Candidatus Latescibacterota bacterium]HJP29864.1 ABC transporter transmembrane domain-containing protein [Candidatus Latescibacterota bacterium]
MLLALLVADLDRDGRYGENWLVLTDERILVLHANGGAPRVDTFPLAEVKRIQTRSYVGNGSLVIDMPDGMHELVRFSQGNYFKFSSIPQVVEAAMASPTVRVGEDDDDGAIPHRRVEHCETCGRALRAGSKVCPACIKKRETFWRLFSYVKPYKKVAIFGFVLTLTMTAIGMLPPQLNRRLIDDVITPVISDYMGTDAEGVRRQDLDLGPMIPEAGYVDDLLWIVMGLLSIHFSRMLINGVRSYTLGWLGQRITYDLQTEIFNYLQLLSLSFYSQHSTGRIMTRVTSDTERMRGFITTGFQDMVIAILTLLGIGGALFWMNWELALLALIPTPIMLAVTLFYRKRIHWVFHTIWRRISALNSQLADTIPGVKVVKAFAQEGREIGTFDKRNTELRESRMVSVKMKSYFLPGIAFITSMGSVILWWFGGNRVLENTLTLGELQAFISYMVMFLSPVRELSRLSDELESAATTAERVFEILDTEPEVMDRPDAKDPGVIEGRVEFRNVSFTYDGFARILDRVSCTVEPGEMIGLVGHSGAGKSTLVNLISRFYDATDGEILIDGVSITDLQQKKLRAQIGVVLQEPLLFQGSIAQNIAYGRPEASRSEIIAAARAANAHKFIMKIPDGYDSEVGERGGRLSGGERQRISIARALIGNPRVLILDEATSSVDTQTEFEIQEALERLTANRTTFAIAHRLSTLKNADRLFVLDKGRIVEEGSHAALLEQEEGVYRNLVDMQTELAKVRAL